MALKKQQGFSLIEVIISMVMLSMIMTMIYGAIHSSRKMAHKGTQRINATNEIRVVQELIRRQISRILPMAFKEEDGAFVIFEGGDDHIMYVSPMPGYLGNGGPYVQLIEIVNENGGKILQFSHWLLSDSFEEVDFDSSDIEPVVLLENIRHAEFSFVKLDEEGEPGDWENSWEDPESTPLMVKLDVELEEGALMQWPEMKVALMLDSTAVNRRVSDHLLINSQGGRNQNPAVDPGGSR